MINATFQSVNVGNIVNLKSTIAFKNGYVSTVGAKLFDEVYEAGSPSGTELDSAPLVMIFNDETTYLDYENITDGSNLPAGTPLRGYYLTEGDPVDIDATVIDGAGAVGKFLIPEAGSNILTVADDLTGGTKLAFEIKQATTIGFNKRPAWEAIVVSA